MLWSQNSKQLTMYSDAMSYSVCDWLTTNCIVCDDVMVLQEDMVMFVQKLPTASWEVKDVEAILSQAYIYQTAFQAAPSHLG